MKHLRIKENIDRVQIKINAAAEKSGRCGKDIKLIAVTKKRSVEEIREAINCGVTDIGENYIQEATGKFSELGNIVNWHMIGHIQTNKARQAVPFADLIHSVDSYEIAKEIGKRALLCNKIANVLIEVNISEESCKFGACEHTALDLLESVSGIESVKVCGLMGMAPMVNEPEETRPYFRKLKTIWDKLPDEQRLYLSMGMTQDFEIAIEEGANMVRIGTAIFGSRD